MKFKLSEIFDLQIGKTPSRHNSMYWNDGNREWISISDISGSKYISNTKEKITEKAIQDSGIKKIPANTVIMSFKLSIGKVAITSKEMYSNEAIMAFIDKKRVKLLPEYVYYLLMGVKWDQNTNKAVMGKTLNKSTISQIIVDVDDYEIQKQKAEALDSASKQLDIRNKEIQKLDTLVKARFVEMFGDTKLNMKKFPQEKLSKIAKVGSSRRVFARDFQDSGIPFFRGTEVGALAEGKKIIPKLFISKKLYKELVLATGKPKIGDLLMPSICPDGRIWQVNTDEEFYFKDARVLWISPNSSDKVNSTYLRYALKQVLINNYRSVASGSTFAEMKIVSLKGLMIILPPIELQNQFASFVQQVDKSKVAIQKSLDEAQTLFDSLMQEYFS